MATALGKVCAACGVERKKKGILYDPTDFMPYCENPYICNEEHPNSPKNLIARGAELKMLTFEAASEKFKDWVALNHPDKEVAERIRRMVTQPITVRIGDPGLARFILDFQKEFSFDSVSDTIRYCVQKMRESQHGFYADHAKITETKAEEKRIEVTKANIEQSLSAVQAPNMTPVTILDKAPAIPAPPDEDEEIFTV